MRQVAGRLSLEARFLPAVIIRYLGTSPGESEQLQSRNMSRNDHRPTAVMGSLSSVLLHLRPFGIRCCCGIDWSGYFAIESATFGCFRFVRRSSTHAWRTLAAINVIRRIVCSLAIGFLRLRSPAVRRRRHWWSRQHFRSHVLLDELCQE